MSASSWYQQQAFPFLCSLEDDQSPNQQTALPTPHNYFDSCTNNNSSAVPFHSIHSDFSLISDFEDFSHFYDDNNLHQQHHQAVANVLTTALSEKKTTTFHVKGKRQDLKERRKNRRNDMKERKVIKKIKNSQNIRNKGQARAVDDKLDAAGSSDVCVYLRAKRGQAINSHSLAERVRRQKISEKMKVLQSLVPGCDKMTGKIPTLDRIIDYIHSLQDKLKVNDNLKQRIEFHKSLMSELSLVDPALLNFNCLASELTELRTSKSYASTVGFECMRISSEHQSIPLHESSCAWGSASLSPWIALLEDREYTI